MPEDQGPLDLTNEDPNLTAPIPVEGGVVDPAFAPREHPQGMGHGRGEYARERIEAAAPTERTLYKYRCITRCTANYGAMSRLFERDQEVIWDISRDGVPPQHFIPLDGGPATPDPLPLLRKQHLADAARRDAIANQTGDAITLKQLHDQQRGNAEFVKRLKVAEDRARDAEVKADRLAVGFDDAVNERIKVLESNNDEKIKEAVAAAVATIDTGKGKRK